MKRIGNETQTQNNRTEIFFSMLRSPNLEVESSATVQSQFHRTTDKMIRKKRISTFFIICLSIILRNGNSTDVPYLSNMENNQAVVDNPTTRTSKIRMETMNLPLGTVEKPEEKLQENPNTLLNQQTINFQRI